MTLDKIRTGTGRRLRGEALQETALPIPYDAAAMPGATVLGTDGFAYKSSKQSGIYKWRRIITASETGEICVGIDTPRADFLVAIAPGIPSVLTKPSLQIESQFSAGFSVLGAGTLPRLNIGRYSGPLGGVGLLSLDDSVASIRFVAGDGTVIRVGRGGAIQAVVDDLPVAGQGTPMSLILGTGSLRIKSNGSVLIGNTTGTERLSVTGNTQLTGEANSYMVGSNNVVGSRKTGWTAPTGTATRSAFATDTVSTPQLAERVKALIDDLFSHGLIGA